MKVIFYTTHCPQCGFLKRQLEANDIEYDECSDESAIIARGITSIPHLEVDGELMNYPNALKWIEMIKGELLLMSK